MKISIVIPTHNRADILERCLVRLFQNDFDKSWYEVVVVDDGSVDNTAEVAMLWSEKENVRYFKIKKSGQGVARNLGIEKAVGEVVVLIGDDIFVSRSFLKTHWEFHSQNGAMNVGCLGLILWDPEVGITPLMEWLCEGGHQFAFHKLKNGKLADFNYFYTSNISLKREMLMKERFDPWFDGYGWEDIELGYRLEKNWQFELRYLSEAVAYHHHKIGFEEFVSRMYQIGRATPRFEKKHIELKKVPQGLKKMILTVLSSMPVVGLLKFLSMNRFGIFQRWYFYVISKKYFLKGVKDVIIETSNKK